MIFFFSFIEIFHRLEIAFWQQNPQLQNMSGFLLEQTQKACLAHLRDRVAESVRTLWSVLAVLRGAYDQKINEMIRLFSKEDFMQNKREEECLKIIENFKDNFSGAVDVEKKIVHTSTVTDAKKFLNSFLQTHLSVALPELLALHPCHVRVTSLAVQLIHKQAKEQHGALMIFLSSYCARKLGEVSELSIKQFKKTARDYSPSIPEGPPISSIEYKNENENENQNENENENEQKKDLRPSIPFHQPQSPHNHNNIDNNTRRPRSGVRPNRRKEISNNLNTINLFFIIVDNVSGSAAPIDDVIMLTRPFELSSFLCTVLNVQCLGVRDTSTSDKKFQNGLVHIRETLHALVESVTACVGDYMGENEIGKKDRTAVGLDADTVVKEDDFPVLASPARKLLLSKAPSIPSSLPLPLPLPFPVLTPISMPSAWPKPILKPMPMPTVELSSVLKSTPWSTVASKSNSNGLKELAIDRSAAQQLSMNIILTHTELITIIENTRRLLLSMIVWANATKQSIVVTTFNGLEIAGKLSIQIVRLLTQCMPSLIYWDVFLSFSLSNSSNGHTSHLQLGPEVGIGQVGSGLKSGENFIGSVDKWESFLNLKKDDSRFSKECSSHPSDALLTATSLHLISTESMIFIITTAARPTTLKYFSSCKYLPYLNENGPIIITRLIGRYVLSRIATECHRLRDSDFNFSLEIAVGTSVFNGIHGSSSDCVWVKDSLVRNWINKNLDPEIINSLPKWSS